MTDLERQRDYFRAKAEESTADAAIWSQLADEIDAYLEQKHADVDTPTMF